MWEKLLKNYMWKFDPYNAAKGSEVFGGLLSKR